MNPSRTIYKIFRVQHNGNTARPHKPKLKGEFESEKSAKTTLRHHGGLGTDYDVREITQILPKSTGRTRGI